MRKILYSLLILSLMVPALLFAQDKKAPIKMEEATQVVESRISGSGMGPQAANWVLVDYMANTYGPAIGVLNPIAYDPASDVVALVHRGEASYAAGSGELWYNISTDAGLNYTRVGAGINSAEALSARYPSMAIGNPTGGDISGTTALFSWPQLTPGAFGYLGYGVDIPVGGASPVVFIDRGPPTYSSQVPCWTEGDYFFWSSDNTDDASVRMFSTSDFGTINIYDIPSSAVTDGGTITFGGVGQDGISYLGMTATVPDPVGADPIATGWYVAYTMTTDNGVSYSDPVAVDFREIPALSAYDCLYDFIKGDEYVSYTGDINIDADGYIHMVTCVTDTTIDANTGINTLVEIFQTASGWDGKIIYEGILDNAYTYAYDDPGLGQMGPAGYIATDGNVFACTWPMTTVTAGDTLCDIFFSYRSAGGDWSTPENLTETDLMNESGAHMAPLLRDNGGGSYTAFVGYFYEADNFGPIPAIGAKTNFWIAPVDFLITSVGDEGTLVNKFELGQNYPNPFNPSTAISYTLAERSNVTLKVFDVLGKEVANLVNTSQEAGSYKVNFDASDLASGLYVYTLNTGNFTSSKKMMLLK